MMRERELTYFKNKLVKIKQEMTKVIETNQPLSFEDYGELSSLDNHFADTASQLEDREVQSSINESAKHILNEVDEALERIQNGTYGICVETGKDIPVDRLKILPYAKRILEAQKRFDEAADSSTQIELSFSTPEDDKRGDQRLQTVDELQYEHGNSSFRIK
ncbi:general stress protein GSP160 [Neobacillus bataviensis LMG 21833]|uniref:General stress protein GSP160 n=1 Tax=Neobacillus bataviensis LMG 21833 TaxID=1117379 RepID=K6EAD8_9BACI|nr:TraR/DksA C4-type zinc finger protein [Neobacillus bataviensis]EKN70366.1 general stress protein GSP160 [Neobacillus bataviensis LMG 21833]